MTDPTQGPEEPEPEPEAEAPAALAESTATSESGRSALLAWGREQVTAGSARLDALLDRHRHQAPVDVALRWYERDRESAGSVVGSALAFRLFLFFVPMLVFTIGVAGFLSAAISRDDVTEAGIDGGLADQINDALTQPEATRWVAIATGLIGMIVTGRTLSKQLAAASCLAWRLPVRARASLRAIGYTVALIVAVGLVATGVNKLRHDHGLAVGGISLLAAFAIYVTVWVVLSLVLPRATPDPGVVLPGAALMGVVFTGLQAVSQLYLTSRISGASELYGSIGAALVVLGLFFIVGRAVVLSLSLNAVVFERFGSISTFVFGLPVLRALPRRSTRFRRYFGLDGEERA